MNYASSWLQRREDRLTTDYERIQELAENSNLISADVIFGTPPEAYKITYQCHGVLRPATDGPLLTDQHQVEIRLPIQYPTQPPQMRWLTEIFHPNINREGTIVCIDTWYPAKFLDELCIMLGKMIQYRNYNPEHPVRLDAALWSKAHARLLPVDNRPLRKGDQTPLDYDRHFEINILSTTPG